MPTASPGAGKRVRCKWAVVRDPAKARNVNLDGVRITTETARLIDDPEVEIVRRGDGRDRPGFEHRSRLPGRWQACGDGQQGPARRARLPDLRAGPRGGPRRRVRGERWRRHSDYPGSGSGAGRQPGSEPGRDPQRHLQLHLHQDGSRGSGLQRCPRPGPGSSATPRPTPRSTWTAPTPRTSWPSSTQLAFQATVKTDDIPRQGIDRLQLADLKYAGELGYAVKLLALAKLTAAGLELRVAPRLVKRGTPLAEVRGPYNAIRVVGDAVGDTFFYGRGAGMMPTASAMVGDLIDVVTGRAILTSRVLNLWAEPGQTVARTSPRPDQEPVLPAVHDRRLARRAGRAGADSGRSRHQHRQRHPARPRRRCARTTRRCRW